MKNIPLLVILAFLNFSIYASTPEYELSGFARVVAGYLDEEATEHEGYKDSISFSQDSLLGLQGELLFNDKLSATIQLLGHTSDIRDSGVEWLYLTYQPSQEVLIKLGKMRSPLLNLTDVLDVGFAYPYVLPPSQVYVSFLFSTYEGVSFSYRKSLNDFRINLELYTGIYDIDAKTEFLEEPVPIKSSDLYAITGELGYKSVSLRTAYITGNFDIGSEPLSKLNSALQQLGFLDGASTIKTYGPANAFQASLAYEDLDYFAYLEHINTSFNYMVPLDYKAIYLTGGINLPPFTVYSSLAKSKAVYASPQNSIPLGIDPILDQLSQSYNAVFADLYIPDNTSITFGGRWDVEYNLALKAEAVRVNPKSNTSFSEINDNSFMLYTVALEWVF